MTYTHYLQRSNQKTESQFLTEMIETTFKVQKKKITANIEFYNQENILQKMKMKLRLRLTIQQNLSPANLHQEKEKEIDPEGSQIHRKE